MAPPTLEERLEQIRSSPKLQNQQQTHLVLSAVEDTLRDQKTSFTPAAYFSAFLGLLGQYISPKGVVNKDVATAIVYLLDLVTSHVPPALLRTKFGPILTKLAIVLTYPDAEAPLLRSSIGCLEGLLIAQDAQAWSLSQTQISPRRAVAGLLSIATDHRPKVRKRAQDAIANVLSHPPPSPSLDHPAADMCAEFALQTLHAAVQQRNQTPSGKKHAKDESSAHPGSAALIHNLQLVKTVANASGGWPTKKLDSLCELLLLIAKSPNEYLTVISFEIFEVIFSGMASGFFSSKLPHLMEILERLEPSPNDTQLMPPWIAVFSRAYDVSAQLMPDETFVKLPHIFEKVSQFIASTSPNVRISAAECLVSFLANCVPDAVIVEPSLYDEKVLEKLANIALQLLNVKYQSGWKETFHVIGAIFDSFRWRSGSLMLEAIKTIGQLRATDAFAGKKEADLVISQALSAIGPEAVLQVLPLNLINSSAAEPGRVWLLPLLRNAVTNTRLGFFKSNLVPLAETLYQAVLKHGSAEKTIEIKIYDTVVTQIWATLPGHCSLPIDLIEAFDQSFAELLANVLYQQVHLRIDICRALQRLVESNKDLLSLEQEDASIALMRVSKPQATENLKHLESFSSNLLAVLANVYTQTLPVSRAPVLQCIDTYLGITPEAEIVATFDRMIAMVESAMGETTQPAGPTPQMPPLSHTLMDLVITITSYLPRSAFARLFSFATALLNTSDPSLQKKAYKIIPRLAENEVGRTAIQEQNAELQTLALVTAQKTVPSSRRDRLVYISKVLEHLPPSDLYFVPVIVPEVVLCTKENNEKTRVAAFALLMSMAEKMQQGGTIENSKVPHMPPDSPPATASLEEFFTIVSAGLAGNSPHAVSSSILALTTLFYQYYQALPEQTVSELVKTMDIFLTSPNREIVRAVMGFIKCSVLCLPPKVIKPKLKTLIPHILKWNHEHKNQLQAKVKHIIERLVRKFGAEEVEKFTPEADRKLTTNIRKSRERAKKKKKSRTAGDAENSGDEASQPPKHSKFNNSLEQAIYGSEDDSDSSSDEEAPKGTRTKHKNDTYIIENEDEPLDLLDKKVLGRISSTLPLKKPKVAMKKHKATFDADGKLVFTQEKVTQNADALQHDGASNSGGVDAYVAAIKNGNAAKRGHKGKLKFSNKPGREAEGDDDNAHNADGGDAMQIDGDGAVNGKEVRNARYNTANKSHARTGSDNPRSPGSQNFQSKGKRLPGDGLRAAKAQRRGLGVEKTRGGRIVKASAGHK